VKILEIDSERRRLSLSIKRVEDQVLPRRTLTADAGDLEDMPELGLSEDVFAETPAPPTGEVDVEELAPTADEEPVGEAEAEAQAEAPAEAEAPADEEE
jgi:small subunit ribosomal protein S1